MQVDWLFSAINVARPVVKPTAWYDLQHSVVTLFNMFVLAYVAGRSSEHERGTSRLESCDLWCPSTSKQRHGTSETWRSPPQGTSKMLRCEQAVIDNLEHKER